MKKEIARTIIIVEGLAEAKFLKKILLPSLGSEAGVVAAHGIVNAISMAYELRNSQEYLGTRVLLVIDADRDQRNAEYAKLLLGSGVSDPYFRLLIMQPEFEILYFQDKRALEVALDISISPIVWELSQRAPKDALQLLLAEKRKVLDDLHTMPSFMELLRRSPQIVEIQEFISAAEKAVY